MQLDDLVYWVWLQQALGFSNPRLKSIIELYGNPKKFYKSGKNDWKMTGLFTQKALNKLESTEISQAQSIIEECKKKGQSLITFNSKEYPERLKAIYAPPCLLYVKGKLPEIDNSISVSIVGTRSATEYGMNMAFDFAFKLAKSDAIVISGGAMGIDITAHRGALMAKGRCVCVLGCGLDYPYLMDNKSTRDLITENGALVSEYPPGTFPLKRNFPIRNRIMAGFSLGVLVVEAGSKSGSLITARYAADEGRDVFAIPGNAGSFVSEGANNLIKQGAKLVTDPNEILEEYLSETRIKSLAAETINTISYREYKENTSTRTGKKLQKKSTPEKIETTKKQSKIIPNDLSDQAKAVLKHLSSDEPKHIDKISFDSGLSIPQVLMIITELELSGFICSCPGKRYKLPE